MTDDMPINSGPIYDHILIREATVMVRVERNETGGHRTELARLFDVRTGVELREIYPPLQEPELKRGFPLSEACAASVLSVGVPVGSGPDIDYSKVVNILELKQRKLDTLVADSVIDQVRVVAQLLEQFLEVADKAPKEERFWLSQQVLSFVRKFTGRELSELQEIIDWLRTRNSSK